MRIWSTSVRYLKKTSKYYTEYKCWTTRPEIKWERGLYANAKNLVYYTASKDIVVIKSHTQNSYTQCTAQWNVNCTTEPRGAVSAYIYLRPTDPPRVLNNRIW